VRLETLGQLKNPMTSSGIEPAIFLLRPIEKSNDHIGNRTRDLPACSTVPQATTLPRAPTDIVKNKNK
jgi:hypothetical protein